MFIAATFAALNAGLAVGMFLSGGSGIALPHAYYPFEVPVALFVIAAVYLVQRAFASPSGPAAPTVPMTNDDRKDFMTVYEKLTSGLLEEVDSATPVLPSTVREYVKRMVDYNVPKGKLNRGMTVVEAMRAVKGALSPEEYFRAATLGWCIEWLQAYFLVADDIMDASETRRGQLCWYKQPDVGLNAINDGIILETQIYLILKRYFSADPLYTTIVQLFQEVTMQTALGQYMDLTSAKPNVVDFSLFSLKVHSDIVIYKTAFYTFYLPIALGMRLANITDEALYAKAREICILMGEYFQVQDDYLDCYGDPAVIGKVGTDIRDNKCGWLINKALETCSEKQRKVLEQNYAKHDQKAEAKVKAIFVELNLENIYHAYEEETHTKLQTLIAQVDGMPPTIFSQLLKRIYKRKK